MKRQILSSFLILAILFSIVTIIEVDMIPIEEVEAQYVISGNRVYVAHSDYQITTYPHTATGGWVYVNMTNNVYSDDVNIYFGFSGTSAKPKRLEYWNPHTEQILRSRSFPQNTSTTQTNFTYSSRAGDIFYDGYILTGEYMEYDDRWHYSMGFDYEELNNQTQIVQYYVNESFEWIPLAKDLSDWGKQTIAYEGMNTWYSVPFYMVAGQSYHMRVWMDIRPSENTSGKYWVAVKPASMSFAQSIANNYFFALDPWWSSDFPKKQGVLIDNSNGYRKDNYQILVTVPYDSDMQPDFDDLRFVNETSDTSLDYWLESKTDSSTADVWVELDNIDGSKNYTSANTTIFMYYGNGTVSSTSNGDNTFLFYDHFTGSSLDGAKWNEVSTPNVTVSDSIVRVNTTDLVWRAIVSDDEFGPYSIAWRSNASMGHLQASGYYEAFGLDEGDGEPNPGSGKGSAVYFWLTSTRDYFRTIEGSDTHDSGDQDQGDTNFGIYDFTWKSGEVDSYIYKDTAFYTSTTYVPTIALNASYMVEDQSSDFAYVDADWICIRNWNASGDGYYEFLGFGTEEDEPATGYDITSLTISSAGGSENLTEIDWNTWYDFKANVSSDTISDLENVTIRVAKNPAVAIGSDTPDFDLETEYWFRYDNDTNSWAWHDGGSWDSASTTYLNGSECSKPAGASTYGNFTFQIRVNNYAYYGTDWDFDALMINGTGESATKKFDAFTLGSLRLNRLNISDTGSDNNRTQIDKYTWYSFRVDPSESSGNLTIRVMKDPAVAIESDSPAFVEATEYWFMWNESNDEFFWYNSSSLWEGYQAGAEGEDEFTNATIDNACTQIMAIAESWQHKVLYAQGRYWVFYSDGTNLVYRHSVTGESGNWSSKTTIRAGIRGYMISVAMDNNTMSDVNGSIVHYVYSSALNDGIDLFYRGGNMSSDGTITWLEAGETTLEEYTTGQNRTNDPNIVIDSSGFPWILAPLVNLTEVTITDIQNGRPNDDITTTNWVKSGGTYFYENINETVPNDATDYIYCTSTSGEYECNLTDITDPELHTGHELRFKAWATDNEGGGTQYGRPDTDDTVTDWNYNQGSTLYENIDESVPDDATTYIWSTTEGGVYIANLSSTTDPESSLDHHWRFRAWCTGTGPGERLDIRLLCDGSQIDLIPNVGLTESTWVWFNYTLTEAEANAITDYSAMQIEWTVDTLATGELINITMAEFEVPSAGGSAETINVTVYSDTTKVYENTSIELTRDSWTFYNYSLSEENASNIGNYANITVEFTIDDLASGDFINITWVEFEVNKTQTEYWTQLKLYRSDLKNGTWSDATGFPKYVDYYYNNTSPYGAWNQGFKLSDGDMYFLDWLDVNDHVAHGYYWNETTGAFLDNEVVTAYPTESYSCGVVDSSDRIHFVYPNRTEYEMYYVNRTAGESGTWSSETYIFDGDGTFKTTPSLSFVNDTIYFFFLVDGTSQTNVSVRTYNVTAGGGWSGETVLITESVDPWRGDNFVVTRNDYKHDEIGIAYCIEPSANYHLKFGKYNLSPDPGGAGSEPEYLNTTDSVDPASGQGWFNFTIRVSNSATDGEDWDFDAITYNSTSYATKKLDAFTVGAVSNDPPSITSLIIASVGSSSENLTAINCWVYYDFKVNLSETDTIDDLENVTIRVEKNPAVAIESDTFGFTESSEYWFRYDNDTAQWEWYSGASWTSTSDYLDTGGCSKPAGASTEGNFTFKIRLSKIATKGTDWDFDGLVFDSQDQTSTKKFDAFTVNTYIELVVNMSTITWSGNVGDNNITSANPLEINVTCNANVKIQVKGNGTLSDSRGHTIDLDKVVVDDDDNPDTDARCLKLTTSYVDWWTGITAGSEQSHIMYWFISIPSPKPAETYAFTWYITVIEE